MVKIKLISRDGTKSSLTHIPSLDTDKLYCCQFMTNSYLRESRNNDNSINFIDPSGGPMIRVGDALLETGRTVAKIERASKGYYIYLER